MDTHSEAFEILTRIRNGESFDSKFTKKPTHDYGIMSVDEDALFDVLTQEEKAHFSEEDSQTGNLTLNIWCNIYVFVVKLSAWVLVHKQNTWNAQHSYSPDFVRFKHEEVDYILDTGDLTLFIQN